MTNSPSDWLKTPEPLVSGILLWIEFRKQGAIEPGVHGVNPFELRRVFHDPKHLGLGACPVEKHARVGNGISERVGGLADLYGDTGAEGIELL